jgi:isoleucyl-tRNA synthetase
MTASIGKVGKSLNEFKALEAVDAAEIFIVYDLSNWYVRRIRDRVGPTAPGGKSKEDAYQTLYTVLTGYIKVLAPLIPFMTDEIYRNLTQEESVHLTDWPKPEFAVDSKLEADMARAIEISSEIHALRKAGDIKVRQPLTFATYSGKKLPGEIEELINTEITKELKSEGEAREIIRRIQEARKEANTRLDESVTVILPDWPKEFEEYIKKETLAKNLQKGSEIVIKK